jgi:hypothetical protein
VFRPLLRGRGWSGLGAPEKPIGATP